MRAGSGAAEKRRWAGLAGAVVSLTAVAASLAIAAPAARAAAAQTIAGPGAAAGKVSFPRGTAVDRSSGDLYVADNNNLRIDKFDPEGDFLLAWGFGVADGKSAEPQTCGPAATPPTIRCFRIDTASFGDPRAGNIHPESVAVEQASHAVYVADSDKLRVSKFGPSGEFIFMIGKNVDKGGGSPAHPGNICKAEYLQQAVPDNCGAGEAGTGKEEFFGSPSTVFVDAAGHLWVGDKERVLKFDSEGALIAEAAVPGGGGGVVRSIGFDETSGEPKSGHLYLKSGLLSGVREYEVSGAPPTLTLTQVGELDGGGSAAALAIDSAGNVYVGDCAKAEGSVCVAYRFLRYDNAGSLKAVFGAGQVIGQPGGVFGGNPLALDEARGALYAASSDEKERSAVQRFALPAPGPLPAEARAEDLLPTAATLAASLNPEGHATEYHFEYLTRQAYEEQGGFEGPATQSTSAQTLPAPPGSEFEAKAISAAIEHLIPETEYRLRIVATNSEGEAEEQAAFTTLPAVAIEAQWSSEVAARSAALHATLDPLGGKAGEWWLEYDTSPYAAGEPGHGTSVPVPHPALPESFGPLAVGAVLRGLEPATTYHYRFAATDTRDEVRYTVHGPGQSFTTAPEALGLTLPDGRAWELVSPPDKHGGAIRLGYGEGHIQAAADGEAVAYLSAGSLEERPQGSRAPERSSVLSTRTGSGLWSLADISTPNAGVAPPPVGFGFEYKLFDPDLGAALLEPRSETPLSPSASERTPYLRRNAAPEYTPLLSGCPEAPAPCPPAVQAAADVPAGTVFGFTPDFASVPYKAVVSAAQIQGTSPSLAHVALYSRVPLAEGVAGSALYLWGAAEPPGGRLEAISELPKGEGEGVVPGVLGSYNGSVQNAVSGNGARVFWSAGAPSSLPASLYVRDTERKETARLDEVQGGFGTGAAQPVFQGASADGTVAFFTDTRNLTPDANENGADLYRCRLAVEAGALKCQLSDLSAQTADPFESAEVQGLLAGLGEDGSRAYLVARGVLSGQGSEDATPGAPNLYLWEEGGGVRFIATLREEDEHDWGGFASTLPSLAPVKAEQSAAASPSGRYLAFMSARELTGYDNRDAKSGEAAMEVFRYDAEADGGAGELICASCNPSGARPAALEGAPGVGGAPFYDFQQLWSGGQALAATLPDATRISRNGPSLRRPRAVHDDGRLFFNAADSLVGADSNGNWDVYEYEPSGLGSCSASSGGAGAARTAGGCVSLISSGTGEEEAAFLDASVGGSDAFLFTPARLSALDEDEVTDVYDARVGGVEVRREPVSECLGEACQPPATSPPLRTLASAAFRGPGTPTIKRARGRCPKGTRRVKRRGEARCVKRHTRRHRHHHRRGRRRHGRAHR